MFGEENSRRVPGEEGTGFNHMHGGIIEAAVRQNLWRILFCMFTFFFLYCRSKMLNILFGGKILTRVYWIQGHLHKQLGGGKSIGLRTVT